MTGQAAMVVEHPVLADLSWRDRGFCVDWGDRRDDPWFAAGAREQQPAAELCRLKCQVAEECGLFAVLTGQEWGVWGGMTEADLKKAVKARRRDLRGDGDAGAGDDDGAEL